ncbi:hypothetical protein ACIQHY_34260 [Streptomyces sp. NPDC092359]|uniref:hypothetical protein n=1 Tax=Streptomyces sp. NPDC092359 TaxID=3366014 RepID=UPI0038234C4C
MPENMPTDLAIVFDGGLRHGCTCGWRPPPSALTLRKSEICRIVDGISGVPGTREQTTALSVVFSFSGWGRLRLAGLMVRSGKGVEHLVLTRGSP